MQKQYTLCILQDYIRRVCIRFNSLPTFFTWASFQTAHTASLTDVPYSLLISIFITAHTGLAAHWSFLFTEPLHNSHLPPSKPFVPCICSSSQVISANEQLVLLSFPEWSAFYHDRRPCLRVRPLWNAFEVYTMLLRSCSKLHNFSQSLSSSFTFLVSFSWISCRIFLFLDSCTSM